ncbi:olfactory receptor-like protein OLF3 [Ornithorhynchus anatinus]|uniref:olfactory receptor-like protein OLF3 n=1 Tax=Ornithorhynchus anatinus TaxID=9258 RepID=UPI000223F763|nr:olfactory receptor-like protein OLF3 [Ornithorhynchus anatinus]
MGIPNQTWGAEFILLGLSRDWRTQASLFVLFLVTYMLTLMGNFLILVLIWLDSRLHSPMYFFLGHLSLIDICYASSVIPQLLAHLLVVKKAIPYLRCAAQLYFSLALGGIEFLLLAVMAFDRYAAVCRPLRYPAIVTRGLCAWLAAACWGGGSLNSLLQTAITFRLPVGHDDRIDHISCELLAVVRLAGVDTSANEAAIVASSVVLLMTPCVLVLLSYIRIAVAVVKIRSPEGRQKAFNTCAAHLTVVALCYGMAIFLYSKPRSGHGPSALREKLISLFYALLTPVLNPVIYSLRNEEMKAAGWKLLGRCRELKSKMTLP